MIPSTKKYETNRLTSIIPSSTSYLFAAFITFTLDGLFLLILETLDLIIGSTSSRYFSNDVSIISWKIFVSLLLIENNFFEYIIQLLEIFIL